jgi:hypothetical protein
MKELDQAPIAITICNEDGIITSMNERSAATFQKYGGKDLVGTSLFNCHPPRAAEKLNQLLQTHEVNAYTIEKNGMKKLIYQCPHFDNGVFAGYIELSLVLPDEMPHFVREG